MEFWGVEVKGGEPLKVEPGVGMLVHLSQASIGEVKKGKGSETACLFVTVDGKKMVLGTLSSDKLPQQQFDLVFDKNFELSHNWKAGSVYFYGYKADNPVNSDKSSDELTDETDEELENLPLMPGLETNGSPETKGKQEKPADVEKANAAKDSAASKSKVKIVEPSKAEEDDEDSEDGSDEDESSDEDMGEDEDESDSAEDDDSDSDEETPKKVVTGKKRAAEESASKTPVPDKKAKTASPQKTDGKKGVHVATPHPSKQAGKTPANKSNQPATPKSVGSHACGTCKKTFNSENALQSHSKAKHSAGK